MGLLCIVPHVIHTDLEPGQRLQTLKLKCSILPAYDEGGD